MINLETAIEENIERKILQHAYSKIGNNNKEIVYYTHDTDAFINELNEALKDQPRYPLDISFYDDKEWDDFKRILSLFNKEKSEG